MLILGINAYHADSAACLVADGALVAAAEEERFCRVKHWTGFPSRRSGTAWPKPASDVWRRYVLDRQVHQPPSPSQRRIEQVT